MDSGAAWRASFAEKLAEMGYKSTKADPDVWIQQSVKPNGFCYYEILLVYVDDILCMSHQPERTMEQIKELYHLKDESVGPPSRYLGANVGKFQLKSGLECWSASARTMLRVLFATWKKFWHKILSQASLETELTNHFQLLTTQRLMFCHCLIPR